MTPGVGAFIEVSAWPVEGARDYPVSDAFAWPLIAAGFGEVMAVKEPDRRRCCFNVVSMNKFDPLAMGETIVGIIEVAALIHYRLQALVVDHRVHAVLIG